MSSERRKIKRLRPQTSIDGKLKSCLSRAYGTAAITRIIEMYHRRDTRKENVESCVFNRRVLEQQIELSWLFGELNARARVQNWFSE